MKQTWRDMVIESKAMTMDHTQYAVQALSNMNPHEQITVGKHTLILSPMYHAETTKIVKRGLKWV